MTSTARSIACPASPLLRRALPLIVLPALLAAGACGGDDDDGDNTAPDAAAGQADAAPQEPDAAPLSASCIEADNHSDLAWIQDNILTPGCAAFDSCHKGAATQAGGLNLEAGQSEAAMLGIDAKRFTDWKLVVAGDPANSYLMVILTGEGGPIDISVGTMPYNNPQLCDPKISAIRRWISAL